ncbi:MAG: hypothetical protein ACLTF1_14635 [Clostridium sp.]
MSKILRSESGEDRSMEQLKTEKSSKEDIQNAEEFKENRQQRFCNKRVDKPVYFKVDKQAEWYKQEIKSFFADRNRLFHKISSLCIVLISI